MERFKLLSNIEQMAVPGTWKMLSTPAKTSTTICCPNCGIVGTLLDHEISVEGDVTPSVVCPHQGCCWHQYIHLVGWSLSPMPFARGPEATS